MKAYRLTIPNLGTRLMGASREPIKFLQDLPIFAKLVIAPVALMMLMAAIAVVVVATMARTDAALSHLIDSLGRKSRILAEVQREATEVQAEMYRMVGLLAYETEINHLQGLALEAQEKILAIAGRLEALRDHSTLTDEESRANDEVLAALRDYLESVRHAADGLASEIPIAIMFIVGVEQSYDRVNRKISSFARLNRATNQRIYDSARSRTRSGRIWTLGLIVVALGAGFIFTVVISRMIGRPIAAITAAMSKVAGREDTDVRIPGTDRGDEIGAMAQALEVFKNDAVEIKKLLVERQETQAQLENLNQNLELRVDTRTAELRAAQEALVRKERLAALGQLTGTVSHELRNPLGAMRTSVAAIKTLAPPDLPLLQRSVAVIDRSITRCDNIIGDLLDYSRVRPLERSPTEIDDWLSQLLDEHALPEGILLLRELDSGAEVEIDRDRLPRAMTNLIDNACQAMINGAANLNGTRHKVLTVVARQAAGRLEIEVSDQGLGIPREDLERIFEPLYSTKSFGVGLGLPLVKRVAEQHGGGIEVRSEPGQGASFTLWLPLETTIRQIAS